MLLTTLRDYQQEAVARALPHEGFGLFAEQRTGKCLMSIAVAAKRKLKRLLIVTPLKGVPVWHQQIKEHWGGQLPEIKVLNFEQVRIHRHALKKWIQQSPCSMVIVDECHRIKKRGSKQSRACRLIGKYADYRLGLTGTPMSKKRSIEDAWAQFDFINPKLFGPYADKIDKRTKEVIKEGFESRFLIKGGFQGRKVIGYKKERLAEFLKLFHSLSYRVTLRESRKKSLLIHRIKIKIPLSDRNRKIYQTLQKKLEVVVKRKLIEVPQLLNLSAKLQQITGGYLLDTANSQIIPLEPQEKLAALLTLVKSLPEKLVICARYSHEVYHISEWVRKLGRTVKTIEGGVEFNGKFDVDVIVIQIQSGLAIDLSKAKKLIWYSWDHSYINHEQMRFRVLSYDTTSITYYYLIVEKTVDILYYKAITLKKKLADLVCDHYRRENKHV